MKKIIGTARRGQLLYNYGPGSILDFRTSEGASLSVLNGSLDRWDEFLKNNKILQGLKIIEPRLQKKLSVNYFITPPVNSEDSQEGENAHYNGQLVGVRFPKNLQCPNCNEVKKENSWERGDYGEASRWCSKCSTLDKKSFVIPTRFILACSEGHMEEFPWDIVFYNIKHSKPDCKKVRRFSIEQKSTIGISGVRMKCLTCNNTQSFENIFSKEFSSQLVCSGKHYWKDHNISEDCKARPRVIQRGASNAYFPCTVSVISIPPFSYQFEKIINGALLQVLLRMENSNERLTTLKNFQEAGQIYGNKSIEEINAIIETYREAEKNADMINLKSDEYNTLTEATKDFEISSEYDFEAYPTKINSVLKKYISQITKVTKLREVRAIRGFTRINPPTTAFERSNSKIIELNKDFGWLPAVENKGEGIFIKINEGLLQILKSNKKIMKRINNISESFNSDYMEKNNNKKPPIEINLSLIFAHTLSHALIREFSITCGYSTSSLKERIYSDEGNKKMCGILIFTSSSDSDGTLGGLSRIADEDRFTEIFINAIKNIAWCSADPICSENSSSLKDDYVLSSCHSCMLIPETSCEYFNKYLDRKLLIDNEDLILSTFGDILSK